MRTDKYQGRITPLMWIGAMTSVPFNILFFPPLCFIWVGIALYRATSPDTVVAIIFLCVCSTFFSKIELQTDQEYPVGHPKTIFVRYPKHTIDAIMVYLAVRS